MMNFEHSLKFSSAEEREQFLQLALTLLSGLLPLNESVRVRICVDVIRESRMPITTKESDANISISSPKAATIGVALRALRQKYGIVQSKIDTFLRLGQQYVSKVETGRIEKPVKLNRQKAYKLIDLGVDANDPLFLQFIDFLEE